MLIQTVLSHMPVILACEDAECADTLTVFHSDGILWNLHAKNIVKRETFSLSPVEIKSIKICFNKQNKKTDFFILKISMSSWWL